MLVNSVVLRHDCPKYLFSIWLLLTCLALNASQSPRNREFNFGTGHTGFFLSSVYKGFDPTTIWIFLTQKFSAVAGSYDKAMSLIFPAVFLWCIALFVELLPICPEPGVIRPVYRSL